MKLLDEAKFPCVRSSLILVEHDTVSPLSILHPLLQIIVKFRQFSPQPYKLNFVLELTVYFLYYPNNDYSSAFDNSNPPPYVYVACFSKNKT